MEAATSLGPLAFAASAIARRAATTASAKRPPPRTERLGVDRAPAQSSRTAHALTAASKASILEIQSTILLAFNAAFN